MSLELCPALSRAPGDEKLPGPMFWSWQSLLLQGPVFIQLSVPLRTCTHLRAGAVGQEAAGCKDGRGQGSQRWSQARPAVQGAGVWLKQEDVPAA